MTADAQHIPFKDNEFDTVVATFTLEASYDLQTTLSEMKRVCKPHGKLLLISRGSSYISLYNEWLKFKAARDLTLYGVVEHLDFDKILEEGHPDLKVFHKERKNMGMTYIYILEVDKET